MTAVRSHREEQSSKVTASVVLYKTPMTQLQCLLECLSQSTLRPHLYIVDHSPFPIFSNIRPWMTYVHVPENPGYGAGHNRALREVLPHSIFHFVLNPDLSFGSDVLRVLVGYMSAHPDVGQLMPSIVDSAGNLQHLCKLLPTPFDLFLRRAPLGPLNRLAEKRMDRFELRFGDYTQEMDVPNLSGCFMLLKTEALDRIGLFDEQYFMYAEDMDLTRRIHSLYRTVFFPGVSVVHEHTRASYNDRRALWIHIRSVVRYFNKWGWFFDRERSSVNREAIRKLKGHPTESCANRPA